MLDFDFFELLDSVTIARSRKHIQKYYDTADIGTFPTRLAPLSETPTLTDLPGAITYNEIYTRLISLNLSVYTPSAYIQDSCLVKYAEGDTASGLTRQGREEGIRRLMSINLLKRLESSVSSFRATICRISELITHNLQTLEAFKAGAKHLTVGQHIYEAAADFDPDDQNADLISTGRRVAIALADMDYITWERDLRRDAAALHDLYDRVKDITPGHDTKLQTLLQLIRHKTAHPINPGNKNSHLHRLLRHGGLPLPRARPAPERTARTRDRGNHRHRRRALHHSGPPVRPEYRPHLLLPRLQRTLPPHARQQRRHRHSHRYRLHL